MKKPVLLLFFLALGVAMPAQKLKLAPPQTPSTRLLINKKAIIDFDFRMKNALIRYTTDGSEPDSLSPVYRQPLLITKPCVIRAKSFSENFLPSDPVTVQVLSLCTGGIDSIALSTSSEKYPASGWRTLCDGQLGDENFRQGWLGFDVPEVSIHCIFKKRKKLKQVTLSLMRQQSAWIFLPRTIEILAEKGGLLVQHEITNACEELPASLEIIKISLPKKKYRQLTIRLKALPVLPDWHPGKGNTGWIFADEVFME